MLALMFTVLLFACVSAPWLGADSSDTRAHVKNAGRGWYPALRTR